jgi:catalase
MSSVQRQRLAQTIASGPCQATARMQKRMLGQFEAADPEYRQAVRSVSLVRPAIERQNKT